MTDEKLEEIIDEQCARLDEMDPFYFAKDCMRAAIKADLAGRWINAQDDLPPMRMKVEGVSEWVIVEVGQKSNDYKDIMPMRIIDGEWYWLESGKKMSNDFQVYRWKYPPTPPEESDE